MRAPIEVVGHGTGAALAREVLITEGMPWFDDGVNTGDGSSWIKLVAGEVGESQLQRVLRAGHGGAAIIGLVPHPILVRAAGASFGPRLRDAHLVVEHLHGWQHGKQPLLCPGESATALVGSAHEVATYRDRQDHPLGGALIQAPLGVGSITVFGHDVLADLVCLRHGWGGFDPPQDDPDWPLTGPRHLYRYLELSVRLPRDVPVADLIQDLIRHLVSSALPIVERLRVWHFPDAAPALSFVKADGCGEQGTHRLVDELERRHAPLSFYAPPDSRFSPATLRSWADNGHTVSLEADLTPITQRRDTGPRRTSVPASEVDRHLEQIAQILLAHRSRIERATGYQTTTVCIHGCQWTGDGFADLVESLGWTLPTHFISHDPRMRRGAGYGPYMIPTALPLPYVTDSGRLLDVLFLPAQWDESQTIGRHEDLIAGPLRDDPARVRGIVGLTPQEYGDALAAAAEQSATRWHNVHIVNFHGVYLYGDPDDPRWSLPALRRNLDGADRAGVRPAELEGYARFERARRRITIVHWRATSAGAQIRLRSAEHLEDVTFLTPPEVDLLMDGHRQQARRVRLEGTQQRAWVMTLSAGTVHTIELCLRR